MALRSLCQLAHQFGPDWNISIGWIAMTLCTNIHGTKRRNPYLVDPFHPASPTSQSCHLFSEISLYLQDGLAPNFLDIQFFLMTRPIPTTSSSTTIRLTFCDVEWNALKPVGLSWNMVHTVIYALGWIIIYLFCVQILKKNKSASAVLYVAFSAN